MSKRTKKRWGYPFLVTCSLVMGLSLWLHYSVSDAADSNDVVVKKLLEAARRSQVKSKALVNSSAQKMTLNVGQVPNAAKTNGKFFVHASEMTESLRLVHRGPYLLFLNPGCEVNLDSALVPGSTDVPGYPRLAEFIEVSKAHFKDLESNLAKIKICPKPEQGYQLIAAAYERKKSQWDIWTLAADGIPQHELVAKLPPTRAHRIKQIAIVLLVLGATGLVSLLIPRFLDRFYIRREDTSASFNGADAD